MTLVNAKPSTIDIDFTIPNGDYDEFERARTIVQPRQKCQQVRSK